jgi:hypothetical protein
MRWSTSLPISLVAAGSWSLGAIAAEAGPDSSAAVAADTAATLTAPAPTAAPPSPRALDDSTFKALKHAFRHQVAAAAVYYHGRRIE